MHKPRWTIGDNPANPAFVRISDATRPAADPGRVWIRKYDIELAEELCEYLNNTHPKKEQP